MVAELVQQAPATSRPSLAALHGGLSHAIREGVMPSGSLPDAASDWPRAAPPRRLDSVREDETLPRTLSTTSFRSGLHRPGAGRAGTATASLRHEPGGGPLPLQASRPAGVGRDGTELNRPWLEARGADPRLPAEAGSGAMLQHDRNRALESGLDSTASGPGSLAVPSRAVARSWSSGVRTASTSADRRDMLSMLHELLTRLVTLRFDAT